MVKDDVPFRLNHKFSNQTFRKPFENDLESSPVKEVWDALIAFEIVGKIVFKRENVIARV